MTIKANPPKVFYHVRHTCRHAVYWSNPDTAMRTSLAPCPWCGAERGAKVPADVPMLYDAKLNLFAFREKTPDGKVPWPRDVSNAPENVTVHHMNGNICCDG